MWLTTSIDKALKGNFIALGNFDGIHLGHQRVLQPILEKTSPIASDSPPLISPVPKSEKQPLATVVTFNPHPREFFSGQKQKLLTPLDEKVKLLKSLGVEQLVLLPFDRELAALSPQEFVEKILSQQLQAQRISVGEDFRFGSQRKGTAADLRQIGNGFGIEVFIISEQTCLKDNSRDNSSEKQVRISSSLIRQALHEGNLDTAKRMLGRSYSLMGKVVTGKKLGRTLGFPTANLELPSAKFLPRYGVYSVTVELETEENQTLVEGVMNLGTRPTVDGKNPTVEVHLLDWSGDLYDRIISINLEKFLRSERKFSSLEELKTQITADCEASREFFARAVPINFTRTLE